MENEVNDNVETLPAEFSFDDLKSLTGKFVIRNYLGNPILVRDGDTSISSIWVLNNSPTRKHYDCFAYCYSLQPMSKDLLVSAADFIPWAGSNYNGDPFDMNDFEQVYRDALCLGDMAELSEDEISNLAYIKDDIRKKSIFAGGSTDPFVYSIMHYKEEKAAEEAEEQGNS